MRTGQQSVTSISQWINKLVLPGFDGLPISQVITFVIKGFRKGVLVTRASSIAFNLLMALLPASIFLFTLIPFVPIHNFQKERFQFFLSRFNPGYNFIPYNISRLLGICEQIRPL